MATSKFLLPTADSVFKKTFGNKAHKNICIDFLNNVLGRQEGKLITTVEFLDTFNKQKCVDDRLSILGIHCTDQDKKSYIIEVQVESHKDFGNRSQYYVSRVLADQLNTKELFSKLTPVILVGVLDFVLFDRHDRCVTHHVLTDSVDHRQDLDLMEAHFIELPKFTKTEDEISSELDKWIFFLKDASKYVDSPEKIARGNSAVIDAFSIVSRHNWTKVELEIYEKELDILRCRQSALETAEAKGLAEGEAKAKLELAKRLLAKKMSIDEVAEVTCLSVEEIKKL